MVDYWIASVDPPNWEIVKKKNLWAVNTESKKNKLRKGDILILYVMGSKCFQGICEFVGDWERSDSILWADEVEENKIKYPFRIGLRLIKTGFAYVEELASELDFIKNKDRPFVYLMGSPANFQRPIPKKDFETILKEMKERPIKEREVKKEKELKMTHTNIQWLLIKLGKIGRCDVWVARNDRNKVFNKEKLGDLCLSELPRLGFEESTTRIIENIDVLWLRRNKLLAAFEVEHTTSIYGGLLRLSDLMAVQPNIRLQLFIVSPKIRKSKVVKEINRPTFSSLNLDRLCRVITYDYLFDIYKKIKETPFPPKWELEQIATLGEKFSLTT